MSAAKHILVPRSFACGADIPRGELAKFHHMTTQERNALARQGRIEQVAPKMWRLTGVACGTRPATESGHGLVSREVEPWVQGAIIRELQRSLAAPEDEGMGAEVLQEA